MSRFSTGRVSSTAFVPAGQPPEVAEFRKALQKNRFRPLAAEDPRDESAGWVDPFLSFEAKEFPNAYFRDYYLFSLRVDRYRFTAAQLRPFLEEAEHLYKEEHKVAFISGYQRKELREEATRKVRALTLPATLVTEVAWNLGENRLLFFSQSKGLLDAFVKLFEESFGLSLALSGIDDALSQLERPKELVPVFGDLRPAPAAEEPSEEKKKGRKR